MTKSSPGSSSRRRPCCCSRTRSTIPARTRSRSSSTGSASSTRFRLGPSRPRDRQPAGRRRRLLPGAAPQEVGGTDPRRDPRPAERGQIKPAERLLGKEQLIVLGGAGHDRARSTSCCRRRRAVRTLDTARIRRKRGRRQGIEYYSELRALTAAERADVALVLVDASEGLVDRTSRSPTCARGAELDHRRPLQVGHRAHRARGGTRPDPSRLRQRPPIVTVSPRAAAGSAGCSTVSSSCSRHTARIPTAELNRFLGELREARDLRQGREAPEPPLRARCRRARRASASSSTTRSDHPRLPYWVENQLRDRFDLQGIPARSTS